MEKIDKAQKLLFEKINKINKAITGLIKKIRENISYKYQEGNRVSVQTLQIVKAYKLYYDQLFENKFDNLVTWTKSLKNTT